MGLYTWAHIHTNIKLYDCIYYESLSKDVINIYQTYTMTIKLLDLIFLPTDYLVYCYEHIREDSWMELAWRDILDY